MPLPRNLQQMGKVRMDCSKLSPDNGVQTLCVATGLVSYYTIVGFWEEFCIQVIMCAAQCFVLFFLILGTVSFSEIDTISLNTQMLLGFENLGF